jgi:hypothetical protein
MTDECLFDLKEWTRRLVPPRDFYGRCCGFSITGPCDIVRLEDLRQQVARHRAPGRTVPTDVFIMGRGPGERRDMTKVGGVPYRPTRKTWPEGEGGRPMTFLAQYCFAGSRDIVGDLPGDVLLVFAEDYSFCVDGPQDFLHFEWYPLGIEKLISRRSIPKRDEPWEFVECYGLRHRTVDYVSDVPGKVLCRLVSKEVLSTYPIDFARAEFSRIRAMKIAGLPVRDPRPYSQSAPGRGTRLLCSLSTISPLHEAPYPWLNEAGPLDFRTSMRRDMNVDLRDGFLMNFYIKRNGEITWSIRFH